MGWPVWREIIVWLMFGFVVRIGWALGSYVLFKLGFGKHGLWF